ncbi:MAG: BlaI/MecI/CopY family transcriptional regulator [Planctomycetaceae bacterium]|jgi:BlaI family penicillinase repressor|nr:BlaI/MecI/CopY family transcriptional regulator [Planctomycetaceae bacterium]
MSNNEISEAQWRVMEVIWSQGEASAADVIDALLPETGWNHQTVRTLLARLVQKGILQTRPKRNFYIYSPLLSREEFVRKESRSFLQRLFHGNADALLVHFVREGNVNQETLDRLQQLINEEKK